MFKNNLDFSSLYPFYLLFLKTDFTDDFVFCKSFHDHDELIVFAIHNLPNDIYLREVCIYTSDDVTHAV